MAQELRIFLQQLNSVSIRRFKRDIRSFMLEKLVIWAPKLSKISFFWQFVTLLVTFCAIIQQAGTVPSWRPAQLSSTCKGHLFQTLTFSQCQKLPQEIRLNFGIHFFPTWKH